MRCCLLVLILCQAGPVRSGKVTDAITHLPVEGATVILCCPQLSVTTDAGGFYTLQAESPTLLRIDKPGYAAIIIPFSDKHDFELKPGARVRPCCRSRYGQAAGWIQGRRAVTCGLAFCPLSIEALDGRRGVCDRRKSQRGRLYPADRPAVAGPHLSGKTWR